MYSTHNNAYTNIEQKDTEFNIGIRLNAELQTQFPNNVKKKKTESGNMKNKWKFPEKIISYAFVACHRNSSTSYYLYQKKEVIKRLEK